MTAAIYSFNRRLLHYVLNDGSIVQLSVIAREFTTVAIS